MRSLPRIRRRVANLLTQPVDARVDRSGQSPVAGVPNDNFSVRWVGHIEPRASGKVRFIGHADDTISIKVGATVVVNQIQWQAEEFVGDELELEAGKLYPVIAEFVELQQGARVKLM